MECVSAGSTQGRNSLAFGLNTTGADPAKFTLMKYPDLTKLKTVPKPAPGLGGRLGDVQEPYEECYVNYGKEMAAGPATAFMPLTAATVNGNSCGPYLSVLERMYKPTETNESLYGILCWPRVRVYNASVTLDANDAVQKHELRSILNDTTSPFSHVQEHVQYFINMLYIASSLHVATGYHGSKIGRYDWPGLLTARMRNLSHSDGAQDATILAAAANQTFAQTFTSFWALYSDRFLIKAPQMDESLGTISYQVARMLPSIPAFTISFFLLTLYVLAAAIVYVKRRDLVTPRMPNSMGTIVPWIIHSRILEDFVGTANLSSSLRDEYLQV